VADAELDELYDAKPDDFTALRTKLAQQAKRRGDTDSAKQIAGARKPTTAAWVVNKLVHSDDAIRGRLADLGERLRAAHAAMDGETIRELSTEQRRLVDDLTRAAFKAAGIATPTGSLRDDVASTLQAAVADPEVTARLGRLTKAEQWSGFGEFGDTAMVFTKTRAKKDKPPTGAQEKPRGDKRSADGRRQQEARATLAGAERAKAEADDALDELQSDLATARLRHQDARRRLDAAEQELATAEDAYEKAKQTSRDAAAVVKEAKKRLSRR
jgi:hypothetical protein